MQDIFPPSRTSDLSLVSYPNSSLVARLAWTAPGGDLTAGQAAAYQIRCYTNREVKEKHKLIHCTYKTE